MRRVPVLLLFLVACTSGTRPDLVASRELLIVVNAPFSTTPYLGQTIDQGVRLAADEINRAGGVRIGDAAYRFRIEKLDNALSPQHALNNIRRAVSEHAIAVVDEGTGVDASWRVAADANLPICIVYQGGIDLVDPAPRPNLFRIAPTDRGMSFRYAEYLVPKGISIAFLTDDTDYGREGDAALKKAFECCPESVATSLVIPAGATDPSPQILSARRSGADALLVWARATTVAEVVRAARSGGWDVPIYTAQTGEDPLVRQQLSDHPEWIDGLTFASGRMTAEVGPAPFLDFWARYEKAFGPDAVGVQTPAGKDVIQPPSYAMYPYDFVKVLAKAIESAGGPDPARVLDALNQVDVQGANGDERGFNEKNHEGVVDDDVYFAVFHDMTHRPVGDDPLSSTLDVIQQVEGEE